ncbi:MAG: hypothetical protein ABEN55_02985 [Bradymonadaceae bacterium]
MADEEEQDVDEQAEDQEEEEEERGGGQKIMDFVSKQMVPINETVEIEFKPGKKVRVQPKYIKFDREAAEA